MRGKEWLYDLIVLRQRITPAYAGKSVFVSKIGTFFKDHPRLCGEKYGYYTIEVSFLGSPPPMRGKGQAVLDFLRRARITPAYAGKSGFHAITTDAVQDHPRLCGEKHVSDSF